MISKLLQRVLEIFVHELPRASMISSDVLLQVIKCTTSVCDCFSLHNSGMGSDELLKVVQYALSSIK